MTWNNGYKRKQFEQNEEKLAAQYREAGMSEDAIKSMYEFDLELYRKERNFINHTQPLYGNEEIVDENSNFPYENFDSSRHGWIEQVKNELLYEALFRLTFDEKELLTLIYIDGYSESNIAKCILKISVPAVHYRISTIYKKISAFCYKEEECVNA